MLKITLQAKLMLLVLVATGLMTTHVVRAADFLPTTADQTGYLNTAGGDVINLGTTSPTLVALNLINAALSLLAAVCVGLLIYAGFLGETKGGDPVPMRLSEVNRILGKVDELAENEATVVNKFVVGETVKVINGPFNTFSGTVEEINDDKKKLKVMVKIFGRKTPLELGFMEVEKE